MKKIIEMKETIKQKSIRSGIGFEGLFRFYLDEGGICTEEIEFISAYTKTFYYDDGWISDIVDETKSHYFHDTLEFIDLMIEYDPQFRPRILMDNDGDCLISIVGFFDEKEEQEGDWETGYYSIPVFTPKIAGYEVIKEEDKLKIYEDLSNVE